MHSFISPFEDDSRPLDSNEQRAQKAAAPGHLPDRSAALPTLDHSDDTGGDDGDPPLNVELPPYLDGASVQLLIRALLDSAIALHLMSDEDFEVTAIAWLNGPLPPPVIAQLQALIARSAPNWTGSLASRRAGIARLVSRLPVSVATLHGFVSSYHLGEDCYYTARVVTLRNGKSQLFSLGLPATLLAALLIEVCDALHAILFAKDSASAEAWLHKVADGQFPPKLVDTAKVSLFLAAAACPDGKTSRRELLACHPAYEALLPIVNALPNE